MLLKPASLPPFNFLLSLCLWQHAWTRGRIIPSTFKPAPTVQQNDKKSWQYCQLIGINALDTPKLAKNGCKVHALQLMPYWKSCKHPFCYTQ